MLTYKKYLLISLFALLLTACSSDVGELVDTQRVAFEVQIPHATVSSRANITTSYSDGLMAKKLDYAVYDADNKFLFAGKAEVNSNRTATVYVDLAIGKAYNFVFWAHAEDAPYTFDSSSATVTLNVGELTCNDDTRDAFYASCSLSVAEVADAETSKTIELRRPFAQINFGLTNSLPITIEKTSIEVPSATKLNLLTGAKSDEQTLTFAASATPASNNVTFPKQTDTSTPTYIAMAYILPFGDDEVLKTATLTAYEDDTTMPVISREFSNLPFKENYRTNIYGKLLTANQSFTVTIGPNYGSSDVNISSN